MTQFKLALPNPIAVTLFIGSLVLSTATPGQTPAREAIPPVSPNRTLPKVEPPKTALEFSANPSPQDFFRARIFEEPLVPMGGEPTAADNAALAVALLDYSKRTTPDDFSSLIKFLETHPQSPWNAALLTSLGLEYYNTAHYSLALDAWREAWSLGQKGHGCPGQMPRRPRGR